ncbi:MAG TPA: NlpC/P60 family protein [Pseudonocardia sp.]
MRHPLHTWIRRAVLLLGLLLALIIGTLGGAGVSMASPAQPPPVDPSPPSGSPAPPSGSPSPPANPSDQQLRQSKQGIASATAQVGQLTGQLAAEQAKADALGDKLEVRRELANKALVDLQQAQAASAEAAVRVDTTRTAIGAADSAVAEAQRRVDQFVIAAYQQGMTDGSLGLLVQAADPEDLVRRAQLTQAVARDQQAALDTMRRAQIAKVNADSLARKAQLDAVARRGAAQSAKQAADGAVASARAAVASSVAQLCAVDARRADIERQLDALTARDASLRAQRDRYLAYQSQIAAEAKARAEAAAKAARSGGAALSGAVTAVGGGIGTVINRALATIGTSYAWGGGGQTGPSKGIRDGGEADEFGDYRKIGFDCSGLMMYAFGGVGIGLPHYSGYQYNQGTKVPIAQIRPGDMLFWAEDGNIHHVALYIGGGQMVEAPYSGGRVRVTPVRYGGGLMPYATRLL